MKKLWLSLLVLVLAACAATRAPLGLPTARSLSVPTVAPIGVPAVGFVEGRVTIGPLLPGPERIDQTPPPIPPEMFAQYVIRVYRSDGTTKVVDAKINSDGTYRIGLGPGSYMIGAERSDGGRMFGGGLQPIEIQSGQTVQLDINIDTGLR
jgi:hypothetical protein